MTEEKTIQGIDPQLPPTQSAVHDEPSSGRMFTQKEVDEIIRTRLERERKKFEPKAPTEHELREKRLAERESRLACRESLLDAGYPTELLEILDTSNADDFRKKADRLMGLFGTPRTAAPLRSTESIVQAASTVGFGNAKHTPRQFPPR